jgi:alpha-galactosidase
MTIGPFLCISGIAFLFTVLISCSNEEASIPLSSLDLSKMEQGYGRPHINLSVTNAPLKIAGKTFASGVGTHATSRIDIDPGNKPVRFISFVGVDDAALTRRGSVSFIVSADEKVYGNQVL